MHSSTRGDVNLAQTSVRSASCEASLWYIYWQLLLAVQPFYSPARSCSRSSLQALEVSRLVTVIFLYSEHQGADLFMDFASAALNDFTESLQVALCVCSFVLYAGGTLHGNVESRESGSPAPVRQGGEGSEFLCSHFGFSSGNRQADSGQASVSRASTSGRRCYSPNLHAGQWEEFARAHANRVAAWRLGTTSFLNNKICTLFWAGQHGRTCATSSCSNAR